MSRHRPDTMGRGGLEHGRARMVGNSRPLAGVNGMGPLTASTEAAQQRWVPAPRAADGAEERGGALASSCSCSSA